MDIFDMKLSVRTTNMLYRAGIRTAEELAKKTDRELLSIRNFGAQSWSEVKAELDRLGYTKPITNADRIRAMTDEELARWMAECNAYGERAEASQWMPWLKQPVED